MNEYCRRLAKRLRGRDQELARLRKNFFDLRAKFLQLEYAFKVNLRTQTNSEKELDLLKAESQTIKRKYEDILNSNLTLETALEKLTKERDDWRKTCLEEKNLSKVMMKEYDLSQARRKEEYHRDLEMIGSTADKHIAQLRILFEKDLKKAESMEGLLRICRKNDETMEYRIFELTNLLETLGHFDLNVASLCQCLSDALKSLIGPSDVLREKMELLKRLSWQVDRKVTENSSLDTIRTQNHILREIIKKLKRQLRAANMPRDFQREKAEREFKTSESFIKKLNEKHNVDLKSAKDMNHNLNTGFAPEIENSERSLVIKCEEQMEMKNTEIVKLNCSNKDQSSNNLHETEVENIDSDALFKKNDKSECFGIELINSHLNGIQFEEYLIRLSKNHEIRIKHSPTQLAEFDPIKVEFVDSEEKYQEASLERMIIYVRNIEQIVRIKTNGINCATQTTKIKIFHHSTQTPITGLSNLSRVNVGFFMLNSERRAIERCLCNLETALSEMQPNVVDQARLIIDK